MEPPFRSGLHCAASLAHKGVRDIERMIGSMLDIAHYAGLVHVKDTLLKVSRAGRAKHLHRVF